MQLVMLTEALQYYARQAETIFHLHLDYLPYARQDRRCAKGEAFSLKVMCKMLNALEYDAVFLADCHSDVGLALLDNVVHRDQLTCLGLTLVGHNMATDCDVIIAPDAGAAKKAQAIATAYGKPLVQCLKTREADGRINVRVLEHVADKKCLVVDDICDGGGTFLALASELNGMLPSELNLFVTHGIFSKGKDELLDHYDNVEAYNEW
jgi:ribose-phosphate pyrophosphokinase